jgi:hypothetical protein
MCLAHVFFVLMIPFFTTLANFLQVLLVMFFFFLYPISLCGAKSSADIEFSLVFQRPCSISVDVQALKVEPKGGPVDEFM